MKLSNEAQGNISWGLMLMLIFLGIGGCTYLCEKAHQQPAPLSKDQPK